MNRRRFLKIGAAVPVAMTVAVDLAAKGTDKTVMQEKLLSPEENRQLYKRGQLYVMIGSPKQGKTKLVQEIERRSPPGLWVIDHDGFGCGRNWLSGVDAEGMADVLHDHFANGGCDVLLVMRGNRSWFSDPIGSCSVPLFSMADWVFGVEALSWYYKQFASPDGNVGYVWKCWTIKDRQGAYRPEWIWDARMMNHEWWVKHVKPVMLNG